jgi:GH15 family glucan-1,4-alpha-glucosidase
MKDWRPDSIKGRAMLSDGQTAALVYEDGTIDWLCRPRFDSAACFASLLGTSDHGGWWLHPLASVRTLKGLIHASTGGMIAAATASLPECPGGERNWDYRYCWLRDATFTLMAFLHTRYYKEAKEWIAWLRRALAGEPIDIQPCYRIDRDRDLMEWQAEWLPGFGGARPVRFGNGAVDQMQLDIYGEVIDAIFTARRRCLGGSEGRPDR